MLGAMQDWDLRVTRIIDHAAREHGAREIVTRWGDGSETRTNWANVRRDALKMTQALRKLGVRQGDRVATLAMNHHRHLISWYGAVGVGGAVAAPAAATRGGKAKYGRGQYGCGNSKRFAPVCTLPLGVHCKVT